MSEAGQTKLCCHCRACIAARLMAVASAAEDEWLFTRAANCASASPEELATIYRKIERVQDVARRLELLIDERTGNA